MTVCKLGDRAEHYTGCDRIDLDGEHPESATKSGDVGVGDADTPSCHQQRIADLVRPDGRHDGTGREKQFSEGVDFAVLLVRQKPGQRDG